VISRRWLSSALSSPDDSMISATCGERNRRSRPRRSRDRTCSATRCSSVRFHSASCAAWPWSCAVCS
jgi:hypothetical protein